VLAHSIPDVLRMVTSPRFQLQRSASVGTLHSKRPPDGNNSRIPYSAGSLPPKQILKTFKLETSLN
jgi:hypothetical protein